MSYFKKILTAGFIIIVVAFGFWHQFKAKEKSAGSIRLEKEETFFQDPLDSEMEKTEPTERSQDSKFSDKKELPASIFIKVPFLIQAPFAIWDPLHEDACEEASLVMLKNFSDKKENISPSDGDVEIRRMIRFEEQNGYGISITLEQLNQIAKVYFGMQTGRVKTSATVDDMKKELAAGRPVIVPAAGKILPNPNFRNGGPNYHMLVVVGYDKKEFITNDPGTRKGEGFRYTFENLFYAIHDWDETNILNGQKAYLVFDQVL